MSLVKPHANYRFIIGVGLLAVSIPASANAGTALMWAGLGHLFVGNAIIGLFEATVLVRRYRVRYLFFAPAGIFANYVSMAVGLLMLSLMHPRFNIWILGERPLYHLPLYLGMMVFFTFALSVLIEWPFYHWAFRREVDESDDVDESMEQPRRTLRATVLAQTGSYLGLAIFYLLSSGLGLVHNAHIVHGLDFAKHPAAQVFFQRDRYNYRIGLDGSSAVRVTKEEVNKAIAPYLRDYTNEDNRFDSMLTTSNYNAIFDLRTPHEQTWQISTDFWGTDGLSINHPRTSQQFNLGLEIPFVRWLSRNATILPGDQVVYQFGPQIVLFDIETRQMAFIARGECPLVILH